MIKRETKLADRAPHLRKKHMIGPDTIDKLDRTGGSYHHDGPYDATLLARNTSIPSSPLEAVAVSNREALKATPRENIIDSIQKHRPLDGVAMKPPGIPDREGRVYNYEEGTDLMIEEGGNYKRWPGVVRPLPLPQFNTLPHRNRSNSHPYRHTSPAISKAKVNLPTQLKRLSKNTRTTAAAYPTAARASK